MNIFEELENLGVSEECFNEIINLIKNKLSESEDEGGIPEISASSSVNNNNKSKQQYQPKKKQQESKPSFAEVLKNAEPSKDSRMLDK